MLDIKRFMGERRKKTRRTSERKHVTIPMQKVIPVHIFTESQIINISKGGVFISTPRPLPTDKEIEIEFVLPRVSKKIRAKGLVKWKIENMARSDGRPGIVPGMGVKFIKISKEDLKKINNYIKK